MYGILVSALNTIVGWIFKQVVVKFVVLFALYFVIQAFVSTLGGFIPSPAGLTSGLSGLASSTWWFLDLFAFSQGAPMVLTAMVYRFLIRRIPLIG
jgi:hypothetical protein